MERKWEKVLPKPVIGVDEAGRGCLAGRVYAAAVILKSGKGISQFRDSKELSEIRRSELFELILNHHQVGIGFASVEEIERLNIHFATLLAMKRAVYKLNVESGHVLIDGKFEIKNLKNFKQTAVVKGDSRVASVAAASIVAKVSRDSYILKLAKTFPAYGFAQHKGYGTALHRQNIQKNGPCSVHRKTFAGVREFQV